MQPVDASSNNHPNSDPRAVEIFDEVRDLNYVRTDRMFAGLMMFQWIAGIVAALVISPRTWAGQYSSTHVHVWAAIFLGGAITLVPVTMALQYPGRALTRHVIAIGQALTSALLIHLTGGRIETHFHVFGSLAFLAFYRDWKVLISASAVVAIDHFARGMFWPQSVYGVAAIEPWRWVEHAGWVVFEDIFLLISVIQNLKDKMAMATQQARLEHVNSTIEHEVVLRTAELKHSEQQLKQSEAKLRKVFEACPETICITSMRDGHFIDANLRLATTGYTLEELKSRAGDSSMMWANPRQLYSFVRELTERDFVQNMEADFKLKDGTIVPCLISGAKIELDGEPCAVTFSSDISDLKRAEHEIIAAREEALAASRAKSEFLSSMSHEIRTPMNAILGMADLLSETSLSPEQGKFVATMTSNGNTLLTLINGILDLARIESGRLNLEETEFEIEELIEHVAETLGVRAHEKKLELTTRIIPGVPARVIGDPLRLRQVLINLVGNAIKFTEQGDVAISVWNEPDSANGTLHFSVRDTGIGIPSDKLGAIFQSFTQADSSATRKYGGTGLGLTIASRLVDLMGGRIGVISEMGKGSTFDFVAHLKPVDVQPFDADRDLDLSNVRVLVVDDNETNRFILNETLTSLGANISEADNGKAALEAADRAVAEGRPFRLVLLDCRMPEMDGFQVAAELKRRVSGPPPIVLMLSSDDLTRTVESARALGIEVYIVKPVRRHELLRAIARALGRAGKQDLQPPVAAPEPKRDGETRPLKILLTDDSLDNRNLIQAYLKSSPCQIDQAENGKLAVEKFIAGKYDLILMDMQMPVLDGYEAVRAIREWERAHGRPATPIAALTASALEEDVQRTIEAGCTSHLSKPIKKARLLMAIRDLTNAPAHSETNGHLDNGMPAAPKFIDRIPNFIEGKRRDLYALTAALERGDYHTLRSIAHRAKDEATSFGLETITDIGQALENAARSRDVAEADRQLRALSDYLDRVELRSIEQRPSD
nr:sensor histidine kinase RcsC [uncultured bacterium]